MEMMIIFLLPDLFISQPESGSEINKPTGNANNTIPNCASDKFNFCLILGMHEAQLEKHKPAKKNKEPTAALFINFELLFFRLFNSKFFLRQNLFDYCSANLSGTIVFKRYFNNHQLH